VIAPKPGQWARPEFATRVPMCLVVRVSGGSVVTACRGRWTVHTTAEVADAPADKERCGCCRIQEGS
jgi:hypothetical protein